MTSPTDGVMFDEQSAKRLVQSNRLVESNPNALYYDLPSGSMFDRPSESGKIIYDVLWARSNQDIYQTTAYRTYKTKNLWYIMNLGLFIGLTRSLYDDTESQTSYGIHSFKITVNDHTSDWIDLPTDPELSDGEFKKELGTRIITALENFPQYTEETFFAEFIDTSDSGNDSVDYASASLQFSFGLSGAFSTQPNNTIPTWMYSYVSEVRYYRIGDNNTFVSGPSSGLYINPFYLFVSNYRVYKNINVKLLTFDKNYINYGQVGFIIGLAVEPSTYVVAYSPIRIQTPIVPNWSQIT